MALNLTKKQKEEILGFVAKHSPYGEPVYMDEIDNLPQRMAGVDLGHALVTMDIEGLCWVEDPYIVGIRGDGWRLLGREPN